MTHRPSTTVRRRAVVAIVMAVLLVGSAPGLVATAQEEGEPRVRDLEYRVRDLTYRANALDNSERVVVAPEETSVTLAADVLFAYDKADLTSEASARLSQLAAQIEELGPREVAIGGHTDSNGEDAYNQDLSVRRAEAVHRALSAELGSEVTFTVEGFGETQPVAPNQNGDGSDNPEGRALNRRVEIAYPS